MKFYSHKEQEGHICECLRSIRTIRGDSVVTIFGNRRKNGVEFVESVLSLATGLSQLGLRIGDVVAIAALNSDWYLEWLLAVAYIGGIIAPLNYRWSFKEARLAMEILRPVMFVVDESCGIWYSELQNNNLPSLRWYVFLGEPFYFLSSFGNGKLDSGKKNGEQNKYGVTDTVLTTETIKSPFQISQPFDYRWAPEGIALICFTSGTTGGPKGVAISHTALIIQSLAKINIVGYSEDDIYLHTVPLCHIGGISSCVAMLMVGACHVLMPKFEAESVVKAIEQHHVSSLITVPAIMADLISFVRSRKAFKCIESLKKILNGGGGLSADIVRDATKIFPRAKLLSAYGMTETCSSLTFMTLYEPARGNIDEPHRMADELESYIINHLRAVCVGKPAPHVELMISSERSSSIGRIRTRGPHVMVRYWDQIPVTRATSADQGWIDTADVGWIDDCGYVWLVGRVKDRIKSGGENVYPEEVEAILSQHPGVSSVVVVGLPDVRLSDIVTACVQIRENWRWVDQSFDHPPKREELLLSSGILQKHCKQNNLTGFKIPKKFILWRKPFPFTSTGKLRREEIRRRAISHMQSLPSKL